MTRQEMINYVAGFNIASISDLKNWSNIRLENAVKFIVSEIVEVKK